jgi:anti-sigma B factor antagonist
MKHVEIATETAGKIEVVLVSGFMDMAEVPKFEKVLDGLIQKGIYQIVLDLSSLAYVSSAGLGAIIGRIREVRRHSGDIKVGGYSEMVFDILKTFGFTEVFETYASRQEALKKFEAAKA